MWGVDHIRAALVILVVGLALLEAAQGSPASADEHRVIVGMATTSANVYPWWWHGENDLDLTNRSGPTIDANVYHQSRYWSGAGGWMRAVARNYAISSKCTGRYVELYDPGGNYLGKLNYVHIATNVPDGYTWTIPASGWNIVYLGTVLEDEPDQNCPHEGAHLHQGGQGASIQHNTNLQTWVADHGHPDVIEPTGDYTNQWMHKVTLIDSDGDGCSDQEELGPNPDLGGQRNPSDPWDFYDVPLPVGAPGTGTKNKSIDLDDTLGVLAKFGSHPSNPPGAPPYDPAYDRSSPTPNAWNTRDPAIDNNGVQLEEVFWSLAQFGHSCALPP